MKAGRLNRRITIQEPTEARGATGQSTPTWSTFRAVWAEVKPLAGGETLEADQFVAKADTRFRIRYLDGLTRKMRISYNGDLYNILSIGEVGFKEGHDIRAEAIIE